MSTPCDIPQRIGSLLRMFIFRGPIPVRHDASRPPTVSPVAVLPHMATASRRSAPSAWTWPRSLWLVWGGIALGGVLVVGLTLLPPWLSPDTRVLLMQAFSSLCHQIPGRSPAVDGVPLAVCDRCLGIYSGFTLGLVAAALVRVAAPLFASHVQEGGDVATTYRWLFDRAKFILVGMLVPLAIDWMGPVILNLAPAFGWTNTPLSRAVTGGLLGMAAAVLLVISIAQNVLQSRAGRRARDTEEPASQDTGEA